jgi:hypothetical protein
VTVDKLSVSFYRELGDASDPHDLTRLAQAAGNRPVIIDC